MHASPTPRCRACACARRIISAEPPTTSNSTSDAVPQRLHRDGEALAFELVADEHGDRAVVVDSELRPGLLCAPPHPGGRNRLMSTPFGITWIGGVHPAVGRDEQLGLGSREGDDRPVRAAAIADAVAKRREEVHRVAHHAPDVFASRAHRPAGGRGSRRCHRPSRRCGVIETAPDARRGTVALAACRPC